MTLACIFPGQGSQEIGMGRAFYEAFATAKETYQEVDDALDSHLSQIIFGDDQELLTQTEHAQPAIMATSLAIYRTLEKETGFSLSGKAAYVAGHSLGEYSALCAAGALSLDDTARLLRLRGQAMQKAVPLGSGTMAAILGLDLDAVEAIAAEVSAHGVCEVANDNAPGQIVISGAREAVQQAMVLAKEQGAKRALELQVSAPFHSSLIADAAEVMRDALAEVSVYAPVVPLVANVTAASVSDPEEIRSLLVQQVTGRVRWRESVAWMAEQGVTQTLEIGHGKVLSGLVKRIQRDLQSSNVATPEDMELHAKAA